MGWLIDQKMNYSPTINKHQPFEQFQYSPQIDYSYAPSIAWESPGATVTGATVTTKKEMSASMEGGDLSGAVTDQGEQANPLGTVALIGGIAVVGIIAFGLLKKKKSVGKALL